MRHKSHLRVCILTIINRGMLLVNYIFYTEMVDLKHQSAMSVALNLRIFYMKRLYIFNMTL